MAYYNYDWLWFRFDLTDKVIKIMIRLRFNFDSSLIRLWWKMMFIFYNFLPSLEVSQPVQRQWRGRSYEWRIRDWNDFSLLVYLLQSGAVGAFINILWSHPSLSFVVKSQWNRNFVHFCSFSQSSQRQIKVESQLWIGPVQTYITTPCLRKNCASVIFWITLWNISRL